MLQSYLELLAKSETFHGCGESELDWFVQPISADTCGHTIHVYSVIDKTDKGCRQIMLVMLWATKKYWVFSGCSWKLESVQRALPEILVLLMVEILHDFSIAHNIYIYRDR